MDVAVQFLHSASEVVSLGQHGVSKVLGRTWSGSDGCQLFQPLTILEEKNYIVQLCVQRKTIDLHFKVNAVMYNVLSPSQALDASYNSVGV